MGNTILATALPSISADLAGARDYTDVVTAYLLPKALATPIGGRLVDAHPPTRVVTLALLLHLVGTIGCAQAGTMDHLIGWRIVAGLGGGALVAAIYALLDLVVAPRRQGQVQATVAITLGLGAAVAPVVGGLVTQHLGWRGCFYISVPPLALCLLYLFRLPHLPARGQAQLDLPGIGALTLMTCPLLLALTWGGSDLPWTSPLIISLVALAALGAGLFFRIEATRPQPLFDPRVLRDPTVGWSFLAAFTLGGAFLSSLLYLPLYVQTVKGFSPLTAGLALLPFVVGSIAGAVVSSRFVTEHARYRRLALAGTAGAAVHFAVLYLLLDGSAPIWVFLALQLTLAACFGAVTDLFSIAVQNATPANRQGMMSSSLEFVRQLGAALGIAVVGSLLLACLNESLPRQVDRLLGPLGIKVPVTEFEDAAKMREIARATLERIRADVQRSLAGDRAAYARLRGNPNLPARLKAELDVKPPAPHAFTPQLEAELEALAEATRGALQQTLAAAVTQAQQRVFLVCLGLCLIACVAAQRMPDHLLRETLIDGPDLSSQEETALTETMAADPP